MSRRVVVTGIGVLAPNGNGIRDFELALRKGLSGIRVNEKMVECGFGSHVAGVPQGIGYLDYPMASERSRGGKMER